MSFILLTAMRHGSEAGWRMGKNRAARIAAPAAAGRNESLPSPVARETGYAMRNQSLTLTCREFLRRRPSARPLIGHAASGVTLAVLLVGALHVIDTTMARLLWEVGGLPVVVALILLHAALFACASLATADGGSADGGGAGGRKALSATRQPSFGRHGRLYSQRPPTHDR
jgi:hypothetical protein